MILTTTQINGIQASTALGDSAFDDTDGDGFLEVVDSWGEPIAFQFLMVQPVSGEIVPRTDVNGNAVPRDLEPGNIMDDDAVVAPQQLRIYLESDWQRRRNHHQLRLQPN